MKMKVMKIDVLPVWVTCGNCMNLIDVNKSHLEFDYEVPPFETEQTVENVELVIDCPKCEVRMLSSLAHETIQMTAQDKEDITSAIKDKIYELGRNRAYISILTDVLKQINPTNESGIRLSVERKEAIQRLREICAKFGDNDWDENLHLADILDKHLRNHLELEDE